MPRLQWCLHRTNFPISSKRLYSNINTMKNNKPDSSELAKHSPGKSHNFDFQNSSYGNDFTTRTILEMLQIKK